MKKSIAIGCLGGIIGLAYIPIQIYASWLLYNHVQATQVMWFVWWVQWPMFVIIQSISGLVKVLAEDKK